MKKRVLATLFSTVFLDLLSLGITIPVLTVIFFGEGSTLFSSDTSFTFKAIIYGLNNAMFPLAQFIGAPILGALSDKYGRRPVLIFSLLGTGLGHLIFVLGLFTGSLPLLFIARIIDGFSGGNVPVALSAVSDVSDESQKSRNFGIIGGAVGLGFIAGPFLGGKVTHIFDSVSLNQAFPFLIAAGLAVLNTFAIIFFLKETSPKIKVKIELTKGLKDIKKVFKVKNMRGIFLVSLLMQMGYNSFALVFPVYLLHKYGLDETQSGIVLGYAGIWIAIGVTLVNMILTRYFSDSKIFGYSSLLLTLLFPFVLLSSTTTSLYIFLPFIGILLGLQQPNLTSIVSKFVNKDFQGEILGINQSFQSIGQVFPAVLSGVALGIGNAYPIALAATIIGIGTMLFFYIEKTTKIDKSIQKL